MNPSKKQTRKYPKAYSAYLDRLSQYKNALEETRQVVNDIIREGVYRDAENDINGKSLFM